MSRQINKAEHWENIYKTKPSDKLGWFSSQLTTSLNLVQKCASNKQSALIDVGAGASTLIDDLQKNGYANITALDLSETALQITQSRLGEHKHKITWLAADITEALSPPVKYDLWHDRAVFHFLTTEQDRLLYLNNLKNNLKNNGYLILGVFGPEGPESCSGQPVVRYDSSTISELLGEKFHLIHCGLEVHVTPGGYEQQYLYMAYQYKY